MSETNASPPADARPAAARPAAARPPLPARRQATLSADSPLMKVMDAVHSVVEAGRSRTKSIERAASIARRLPLILFGASVALGGVTMLTLAVMRALVEVTDVFFAEQKPWVAWLLVGGILFVVALVVGTVRNKRRRTA